MNTEYEAITKYERNQTDLMYAVKQIEKYGSEWVWLRKRWRWAVAIPKSNTSSHKAKNYVRSYKREVIKPKTELCLRCYRPFRSTGNRVCESCHNFNDQIGTLKGKVTNHSRG